MVMAIKINGLIPSSVPEEVWVVLQSLAEEWGDVIDDMLLQVVPLKGGMTNEVYQINWPTNMDGGRRKVLVRLYGEGVELFFNREDELRTFECMSRHGQGPRLLATFAGGRVEDFIHARTLCAADLRKAEISGLVARKLRQFHSLDMPGPRDVLLWDRLRTWLSEAKSACTMQDRKEFCLDTLDEEIRVLEQELQPREDEKIGFCHNDLQYGNIMIDEDTNAITIIDYEYASFNPVAYDIANHFCEMAANYHSKMPHILDYSKYPDLEERRRFIRIYLTSAADKPSEAQVDRLLNDVERYTLANHLFWGLWALISVYVNKIEFDYMEYGRQRFKQYWLRKPLYLPAHYC